MRCRGACLRHRQVGDRRHIHRAVAVQPLVLRGHFPRAIDELLRRIGQDAAEPLTRQRRQKVGRRVRSAVSRHQRIPLGSNPMIPHQQYRGKF